MKPQMKNPFAPRQYGELEQINEHVYLFRNIVNSTIFVGSDAIAVIDTQVNHALAQRLLNLLKSTFNKPIRYAINTHYHWDHTNGNPVFKDAGALLVGNRDTADFMVSKAPRQKSFLSSRGFELGPDPLLHDIFIEDQSVFDLGGIHLECSRGHSAETDDPTLIYCPEANILAAGDTVMTGSFPIFGQPVQQEGLENYNWVKALDEVRTFNADGVCPGHGPLADTKSLQLLEDICRYFLDETKAAFDRGLDLHATITEIEAKLPEWIASIPEVWGTPRYAILRAWAGLADLGEPGWQHVKPSAIPENPTAAKTACAELTEAQAYCEAAEQCAEGGDLAQSVSILKLGCEQFPENAELLTAYGETLIEVSKTISSVLEKGDCFNLARQCWQKALAINPQYAPALLADAQFLVMMAFRNGDTPAKGLERLDQAESVHADPAKVAFYRGIAARCFADEDNAAKYFAQALAANPGFMPARLAMMK